ncbi:Uma2 family endonuclease [Synechococcales cyanobacterium C]|uniref:Uma2 family endonuclease n=1 Tax=Petrachloros mirabilis ULC683 TaxID=2781853 RepID=A0A8K2A876_9CYAN|nr:Uma2 family endonuclease [Petrachloros mirabilis]NCJ06695.1 Uma2 family endonuclease [Petrachloros mirabilis ULC683]
MVNSLPVITTAATETWVDADWEDFLTFADDPTLVKGRFYYDQNQMRIEMSPLGVAHGRDNTVVSLVINLYATVRNIPILGLINTTFRKFRMQEAQPDIAFYMGADLRFPPHNNTPINLDDWMPPTLVVEIAASSLSDDLDRKQRLYLRMGVREYWVVDVSGGRVFAFSLSASEVTLIHDSQVLPGLAISTVEEALVRSQSEDDGAISRWLLATLIG